MIRVLLVDDNEPVMGIYKIVVEGYFKGHKKNVVVDFATDGEAVEKFFDNFYDVVFLDWVMNHEDKGKTAKKVVESIAYRHIYMMTGFYHEPAVQDFCLKHKIPILEKPFSRSDMLLLIEKAEKQQGVFV